MSAGTLPRGATPTFTLTFRDVDLTTFAHAYVTFQQGSLKITKKDADLTIESHTETEQGQEVTVSTVSLYMGQAETLSFTTGSVEVQANFTTATGERVPSEIARVALTRQLLAKVVE